MLQLGLYYLGLYRVSADESARSLLALRLSWANALDPWVWPPFYKIVVGLFLKLDNDVFIAPRILVGAAGLLVIPALMGLSNTMFADHKVGLIAGLLAVPIPDRLILSVTPLSDIYFFLLLIVASLFILRWLQTGLQRDLIIGCVCLALASADRYEGCFFAVILLGYVTGRWYWGSGVSLRQLIAVGAILSIFPTFWIADNYLWYGSFSNLADTREQFIAQKPSYYISLAHSSAGSLIYMLARFPMLVLGIAAFWVLVAKDKMIYNWAAIFFLPLFLITTVMLATMSVPMTLPWRTSGVWVFLLLPFTALALVRISEWLWEGRARNWGLAGLTLFTLVPPTIHTARVASASMQDYVTHGWRREREAGLFIRNQLARSEDGKVLIDSTDNYEYLDVMTGSTVPQRFVLTSAADPLEVANSMPLRAKYYRDGDEAMIQKYFADKFALDKGGSVDEIERNDIKLILVRAPDFVQALDGSSTVERLRGFGPWVLYRVRAVRADNYGARS